MHEFTQADRNSAVWLKLKSHLEKRLDGLRRKNDGDLTPEQTQRLRGRIAEIKAFLALENDPPTVE